MRLYYVCDLVIKRNMFNFQSANSSSEEPEWIQPCPPRPGRYVCRYHLILDLSFRPPDQVFMVKKHLGG